MPIPDRRTFLHTAGRLAAGAVLSTTGPLPAQPRVWDEAPKSNPDDPLKPLDGTGILELPAGATRRLGTTAMRITGNVNALQFSPRGTTLVSATSGELRGWDPRTGKVLFRLAFPTGVSVDAGRLTAKDTFLLMVRPHSGGQFEFRQYAFASGKLVNRSPAVKIEHSQRNAFSVDGSLAAVVHSSALCVHDTATGKEKWREVLSAEAVADALFFPDGSTVALAGKGEVKLFAAATGKPTGSLKFTPATDGSAAGDDRDRERDHVSDLAVSADGKWLAASVGEDQNVVLCWDVKAAAVKHRLTPASKPLGFTPTGGELLTVDRGEVTVWSTVTGAAVRRFVVPIADLHLSPDGMMIAAEAGDAAVLIDSRSGKPYPHSADPPGCPTHLRFAGPDRLVGRLNEWGGWVEWDPATGRQTLIRPPNLLGYSPLTLSADGRVGLFRRTGEYTAFAMATGLPLWSVRRGEEESQDAAATLVLTPDGRSFVGATDDGLVVISAAARRVIPHGADAPGEPVAVATDGRTAVVGYRAGNAGARIDVYDLGANRRLRTLRVEGDAGHLLISPDGAWLVAGHDVGRDFGRGQGSAATIFDIRTGRSVFQIRPKEEEFESEVGLALSLDHRMLARVGSGSQVRIWEVQSNQLRATLDVGKDADLKAAAFSPDGRTLAVSANGGPVFLWDLYPGSALALEPDDLECAWQVLAGGDAATAFKAIRLLVRGSGLAVGFLRSRIAPLPPADPQVVDRHITDLDHKEFRKREVAFRSLAALGERVRDHLAKALAANPAPEVRERLERLLAADERPSHDLLRRLRAIEAVEVIGTRDAADVLTAWAGGAPGAVFTTKAGKAARRVAARIG